MLTACRHYVVKEILCRGSVWLCYLGLFLPEMILLRSILANTVTITGKSLWSVGTVVLFLNFLKSIKYLQKKYLRVDNKTYYHSTNFY
jgi:hypothetical protein